MANTDETQPSQPPMSGDGPSAQPLKFPESIGPYRLTECLGEGGMGTVYKASQLRPVKRIVAVKLIKAGFDSAEVIARFESERQALARMDHPNIARVLDAGTDDRHRPYFVMEYVPGIPITKYADDNRLSITQRLELVLQVCDAIGHAHAKSIIHRDVKAGNVLAYTTPDGPQVKVIDFGVAKALTGDRLTDLTLNTAFGQAIGTYESMSPEQAEGSPDIDTRTDVYAIGCLLYELLSGAKPFDKSNLAKAAQAEIRRIIREEEPPRPSTQFSSMGNDTTKIANARQIEVGALSRQLRSELDWIPLMALRKERERRYDTPQRMAGDIQNYLDGKPLLAAPDSVTYRVGKFVRRNRGAIIAVAGFFLVLLLGIAGTTVGLLRESRQRIIAERATTRATAALTEATQQRARAEARFGDVRQLANDFMFKFDSALIDISGATPARKMLADTALKYLDRLSQDTASDKSLTRELAISYLKVGDILGSPAVPNVGETDKALLSYDKSLQLRKVLASSEPDNVQDQRGLSATYQCIGDVEATKGETEKALAAYRSMQNIAQALVNKNPQNVDDQRGLAGSDQRIGMIQAATHHLDDALQSYSSMQKIDQTLANMKPDDIVAQRDLSISWSAIGDVQRAKGQMDMASNSYQETLKIVKKLADAHPDKISMQRDLETSYSELGDYESTRLSSGQSEAALAFYQQALEISHKLANDSPGDARAQRDLSFAFQKIGGLLLATDKPEKALPNLDNSLRILRTLYAADQGNRSLRADLVGEYVAVAGCQFFLKDFQAALLTSQDGLKVSPGRLSLLLMQAHALLFSDQLDAAKQIYLQHRGEKLPNGQLWEDAVRKDFANFEKHGITCDGVARIRSAL